MMYLLNQPIQDAEQSIRRLLGDDDSHRLNPSLMEIPPGPVLLYVRNMEYGESQIKTIVERTEGELSRKAVAAALERVVENWHQDGRPKTRKEHLDELMDALPEG